MGKSYDVMNLLSSFGFSEFWRWQCVSAFALAPGARVCDMMAGTGECWRYITWQKPAAILSVDFSSFMIQRQTLRRKPRGVPVSVLRENALATSIPSTSIDLVVSAFGLKTLGPEGVARFAREIRRILKPGGRYSLLEISAARDWWLGSLYRWYIDTVIPQIGRLCLGDIECYRTLGVYTKAFDSCANVVEAFRAAGLEASLEKHFFGCATSLVGRRPE